MKHYILLLAIALVFAQCGDDTSDGVTKYKEGTFVVNQGMFNSGTGTISHIEADADTASQNIYADANMNGALGNVAQAMIRHEDTYYVSVNNAAKIVLLEKETMTNKGEITNISQPRYFASDTDKLYVSSWGSTGSDGAVYEVNTSDNTLSAPIVSGNGPEGLLIDNGLLYVAKGGGFSVDSLLVIVDIEDNSIVKTIEVPHNPSQIVKGNGGDIYVLCGGAYNFSDPSLSTKGALVTINNQEIVSTIELSNGASSLAIDNDRDMIYFQMDGTVQKMDVNSGASTMTELTSTFAYGLGFDEGAGYLYVADAKDFASNGDVLVFDRDDVLVKTVGVGIIPGYFHFE